MSTINVKKDRHSKRLSYTGVIIVFIAVCAMVCIFSFLYYKNLHNTIREESKGYLQEVSRRVASNIDRITQDNFAMLDMMAASLTTTEAKSMRDTQKLLENQQVFGEFDEILLVDDTGKAYNMNDSGTVFFTFDHKTLTNMLNEKRAIDTTQVVKNQEYFVFIVSLENLTVDNKNIMALAGCYNPDTLEKALSMASFNDQAYSQIINKSGTLVTKTNSPYAIKSGYNIFATLENATLDDDMKLERLKDDIQNDAADQISFSMDGKRRYMVYTPIQPDDWYLLTFVPFQAVNEKSDLLLTMTIRICGLIVITFGALIGALYYVFHTNKKRLERIAYVDMVTGGNTIQKFYQQARNSLDNNPNQTFALVYTNIQNFKILNSQLGRKNCDALLHHFNVYGQSTLLETECMGRLFADNFCILMRYENQEELLKRFERWDIGAEEYIQRQNVPWHMPSTEFGVYVIDNADMPFPEMVDRAKLALKEYPRTVSSRLRYAFYDDAVRTRIFREKQLEDMMEEALKNREFEVYLQPKYRLPNETIGGAEALVRWNSTSEGMIYPNEFIPLFEKNGFIVSLDLWVFEETCKTMKSWIERGFKPVKVSINCSRIHFKNEHFLQPYINISNKYKLDKSLIEIELTESVVFENTEYLTKIIQDIRSVGFGCSMDDFGSGYSSLNLIQSIPVDTLKIDKVFFQKHALQSNRMEAVIGSIIKMAHSLNMVTVAEGVEYEEQVEMLKQEGCDYIQGYVFDRPMTIEAFEQRAFVQRLTEVSRYECKEAEEKH